MYIYIYYIGRLAALGLGVCWFNGLGFSSRPPGFHGEELFSGAECGIWGLGFYSWWVQILALFGFRASVSRPGDSGPPTLNPSSPPLAPLGRPWAHFEHT